MRRKSALIGFVFVGLLAGMATCAQAQSSAELDKVLRKLDAAAATFKTTAAEFQFETVQTDPFPDKETQKGRIYYEHKGNTNQMAAHIEQVNGRAVTKVYSYTGGVFKLYEGGAVDQVTVFKKLGNVESYLMLGFGASGKELEEKWTIKSLGQEKLDGVATEKLELVAKDPAVRKNLPKVTIWVDTERGVSLKQLFDEGPGVYRVCVYFNLKVNQPLPKDALSLPTSGKTSYVTR